LTGNQHLDVSTSYDTGYLYDSTSADVLKDGHIGSAYVNNCAVLRVSGGSIDSTLDASGASSVNMSSGFVAFLFAQSTGVINVNGGTVDKLFSAGANAVNVNDGSVSMLFAHSGANVYGGTVGVVQLYSTLDVFGGTVAGVHAFGGSTANLSGGSISSLLLVGGTLNFYGGAGDALNVFVTSTANVFGGSIGGGLWAHDTATVNVSGGNISGGISAVDASTITFYGTDFQATGGLTLDGNTVLGTGVLSGKWSNGTPWSLEITNHAASATIRAVPEPSTFVLLGMGTVGLLAFAWRRRRAST
jgi:hypothetical protein